MSQSKHPFELLIQGLTKHLLILWAMLASLFVMCALEAFGLLQIGPTGSAVVGLIFVSALLFVVSVELTSRWFVQRRNLRKS